MMRLVSLRLMPLKIKNFIYETRLALVRSRRVPQVPHDIEVIVVSPGGVATTEIIRQLSRYVKTNNVADNDGLKHIPRPSRGLPKSIFITGDPQAIYRSIRRRGWVSLQGAKLGSVSCVLFRGALQRKAFISAVERQRTAWEQTAPQSLFIDYVDIWDRLTDIAAFAEVTDPSFLEEFPPRRERSFNEDHINSKSKLDEGISS